MDSKGRWTSETDLPDTRNGKSVIAEQGKERWKRDIVEIGCILARSGSVPEWKRTERKEGDLIFM